MKKGVLTVFLCFIIWGFLPVFWKLFGNMDAIYVLSSRIVWSLVFCVAYLAFAKKKKGFLELKAAFREPRTVIRMLLASIFITVDWGVYIWAVGAGYIVECSLGYYLNPIIVVFFGFIIFKEKLNIFEWISVALALAGIVYACVVSRVVPWVMLVEGSTFAIYGVFKKKVTVAADVGMVMETAFVAPFAIAYIIFAEATGKSGYVDMSGASYLLFVASGVVTALPLFLYSKAVRQIPYSLAGIITYVSPTLQFLIGILIYKENPDSYGLVALVLIWLAVAVFIGGLIYNWQRQKKRETIEKV